MQTRVTLEERNHYHSIVAKQGFDSLAHAIRYGLLLAGKRKTKDRELFEATKDEFLNGRS